MTVLVSVKINDGVVMAADSASSFASGMVYRHADKIVNLRQGLPIGAMVTGAGGIGNESIDTLLKDLRRRFNGEDEARGSCAELRTHALLQSLRVHEVRTNELTLSGYWGFESRSLQHPKRVLGVRIPLPPAGSLVRT
jgi:ATP-dependent protease HslVU (ClpYQ) peptidase subunit